MKDKILLHRFTKIVIDFLFFSGIITCALVPVLVYAIIPYYPYIKDIAIQLIVVMIISGVMSVYILGELRRIFKTIVNTDPFTLENVTALRNIAIASFVISVTFFAKCTFWFTLATALIIVIFAIAGLFCLVLADVFKQAVIYKEENDLTV